LLLARSFTFLFSIFISLTVFSQGGNYSTPGGSHSLADYYRRQELITDSPSPTSLLQQSYLQQFQQLDSLLPFPDSVVLFKGRCSNKNSSLQLLPVSVTIGYNTHHPFGWNDGAMIPANGLQTLVTGGILWKAGKFSLQLMPQLVYASNPHFETFPTEHYDGYWATYYRLLNNIDMPERFST